MKITRITPLLRIALFGVFGLPLLLAQEPPAPPVELRFLFVDETAGAYSIKIATTYRKISSAPYVVSAPFVITAGSHLDIFKETPDPKTGRPTQQRIASVTPPANTTSALAVVTPKPAAPGATAAPLYDVAFYNADPATFPSGSIRLLNLGRSPMAAQFGSSQFIAAPYESKIVHPQLDSRHRTRTRIGVQASDGWQILYDSITTVRENQRVTGVLVYSPSGLINTYTPSEIAQFGPPPPGHYWLTYSDAP